MDKAPEPDGNPSSVKGQPPGRDTPTGTYPDAKYERPVYEDKSLGQAVGQDRELVDRLMDESGGDEDEAEPRFLGESAGSPVLGAAGLGEFHASTGGYVDLDRILGRIPVALVFLPRPAEADSRDLMSGLGERLSDFGHDRVQVLGVIPSPPETTEELGDAMEGNARVLADPDHTLADHFGVDYKPADPTTVLVAADGQVAEVWTDHSDREFADRLLERVSELVP
jgi:peroxiredoxin